MKLSECKVGILVVENCQGQLGQIGHIVGLTYNVSIRLTAGMSVDKLRDHTIPLVAFPDGTRGIHHCHLEIYKG